MKCLSSCLGPGKSYRINGKKFTKVKTIGEGGYAFVVEVRDRSNQRYALKCVRLQCKEQEEAIEREVSAYRKVTSSHVMELLDHCYVVKAGQDKMAYLLFPLMKKGSVQDILTRNFTTKGHVTEKQILDWTVQLCKAAAAFHNKGLAHRDIKPGNMMLTDSDLVLLADLGSVSEGQLTISSRKEAVALQELAAVNSTSSYRAPELFEVPSDCTITEAVDIWSIGCTMFAVAFGESPFDGSATAAVSGRIRVPKEHIYSNKFIELIKSCLVTEPSERPSTDQLIENITNMFSNR